jgi:hypothetical protein
LLLLLLLLQLGSELRGYLHALLPSYHTVRMLSGLLHHGLLS